MSIGTASAIFDLIAPQYASDAEKDSFLALAASCLDVCQYGSAYNKAVAYLAAHNMTLIRTRGATADAGTVGSKREGDLGIVYGKTSSVLKDNSYLSQTHYGQYVIQLRRENIVPIGVTGGYLLNKCSR